MNLQAGISEKRLNDNIALLTTILSDEMILYVKTRKFHWNVSGESFMELHTLFQNQYTALEETIELVDERINTLGGKGIESMKESSGIIRLNESPDQYPPQKEMMQELLNDHESVIVQLKKNIEAYVADSMNTDINTTGFLTDIVDQHENTSRMLRKYVN